MASLPEDILMEIILRLPATSLPLCKFVSRSWRRIISSSSFVQSYTDRLKRNPPRLLFTAKSILPDMTTLSSLDYERHNAVEKYDFPLKGGVSIVGSCNGLVCLTDCNSTITICNPATSEHIIVPFDRNEVLPIDYNRNFVLGFGHDPINDKYKVVRVDITYNKHPNADIDVDDSEVHVYTLGTKAWRRLNQEEHNHCRFAHYNVPYVNGALHWFRLDENCKRDHDGDAPTETDSIMSFDVVKEKFRTLGFHTDMRDSWLHMGNLQECLSVSAFHVSERYVDIWLMKDYGVKDSWSKLFSIAFPTYCRNVFIPVVIRENGEILLASDIRNRWRKGYLYEYEPMSCKVEFCREDVRQWSSFATYVETLVSIPGGQQEC